MYKKYGIDHLCCFFPSRQTVVLTWCYRLMPSGHPDLDFSVYPQSELMTGRQRGESWKASKLLQSHYQNSFPKTKQFSLSSEQDLNFQCHERLTFSFHNRSRLFKKNNQRKYQHFYLHVRSYSPCVYHSGQKVSNYKPVRREAS